MVIGYSNTSAPNTITIVDSGIGVANEVIPVRDNGALIYRYIRYSYMPNTYNNSSNTFPTIFKPTEIYPIAPLIRAPA